MREDAFRAFLAGRLTSGSVSSYVSKARRIERELRLDLDACDLSEHGISNIALQLKALGVIGSTTRDCTSSARAYAALRDGGISWPNKPKTIEARSVGLQSVPSPRSEAVRAASVPALLIQYAEIMDELRERGVVRTGNSPVGDFAENLFATAFGWTLNRNSQTGHDATDAAGLRYEIKSRRLSSANSSRQLGALRRLEDKSFDCLAAVLFGSSFDVFRAVIVPHAAVVSAARRSEHTNSWFVILDDRFLARSDVKDVTADLAIAVASL